MRYDELVHDQAPRWPYPVHYGKENEVHCDVLVLGGGIAGCWAAIGAARKGARVVLVEKGATVSSGAGGSGVDHWHCIVTNPASKLSPEEFTQALLDSRGGWRNGLALYITSKESYDCLLEIEKMGMRVRDRDDEFQGAEFRDEATKLLFAYDYSAKYCARVWGHNVKKAIYKECQRLGVQIYDHTFISSLLTADGKAGGRVIGRVVGATGVHARTGEFYIFKSKASVLSMYFPQRQWIFSTEIRGLTYSHRTPNLTGDGHALAWKAGAVMAGVEASSPGGRRALRLSPICLRQSPQYLVCLQYGRCPRAERYPGSTATAGYSRLFPSVTTPPRGSASFSPGAARGLITATAARR